MDLAVKVHGHGQALNLEVCSVRARLRQESSTDLEVLRRPRSSMADASRSGLGHASSTVAAEALDLDATMAPDLVQRKTKTMEWLGLYAQQCWPGHGAGNGGGAMEVKLRGGGDGGEERN